MLTHRPRGLTVRVVRGALLALVLAAAVLGLADRGRADAGIPSAQHSAVTVTTVDQTAPRAGAVVAGAPRAADSPSPSPSTSTTKKKKNSASALFLPILLIGGVLIFYMTSRKRKLANGGTPPARGAGGLFGNAARRPASPPPGRAGPSGPGSANPPSSGPRRSPDGRPAPKRRGR